MNNLLNLVLILPLLGFLFTLLLPKDKTNLIRLVALVLSLGTFVLSLGLTAPFYDNGNGTDNGNGNGWHHRDDNNN